MQGHCFVLVAHAGNALWLQLQQLAQGCGEDGRLGLQLLLSPISVRAKYENANTAHPLFTVGVRVRVCVRACVRACARVLLIRASLFMRLASHAVDGLSCASARDSSAPFFCNFCALAASRTLCGCNTARRALAFVL
eukprot:1101417-Amphidinium_carterae.1